MYMYKIDSAKNNQQCLICDKTHLNQTYMQYTYKQGLIYK